MAEKDQDWVRGPVKLPNWSNDPFGHMTKDEKRRIKYLEREADEKLKSKNRNGTFCLRVPLKLPGRMVEPESMTIRRKGRQYMDPHPEKMKEPKLWRGRGRVWRLERDREGRHNMFYNLDY